MGVFVLSNLDVLVEVAGGGNGTVFEEHGFGRSEAKRAEGDAPTFFVRGGVSEANVPGSGDEGLVVSGVFSMFEDEIRSVAFGDSAKIELHSVESESGGLIVGIKGKMLVSADTFGCFEHLFIGEDSRVF